jgi:hypothetical protein
MRISKEARQSLLRVSAKDYELEANRIALKGTVILGSKMGYTGKGVFVVEDIARVLDEVNVYRVAMGKTAVPCLISEAELVGRTGDAKYQEKVFRLEFSISPRSPPMAQAKFYCALSEYANALGVKLKQTRVYLEFDYDVTVLKAKIRKD